LPRAAPGLQDANDFYQRAAARLTIDFKTADLDDRPVLVLGDCSVLNYFVGARYARLQQEFGAEFRQGGELRF
jgi:hypothetical protein